ncbi:MAG: hypothetical protein ACJ8FS_01860 [Sphingomicrobium sp.]
MKAAPIALAAALLLPGAPAGAQTASDVRCLILSNVFAQKAAEPDVQKVAQASFYFYLGRVADRVTAPQLKALFDAQSKTITDATAGAMMKNCVQTLQSRADLLQSLAPPPAQPAQPPKKP